MSSDQGALPFGTPVVSPVPVAPGADPTPTPPATPPPPSTPETPVPFGQLEYHYSHATTPAGAGTDTVISNAVQVDPQHRLSAAAAMGDVAIVGVNVDDPDALYDFKGLWRWYVIENACPTDDHYAFNGYIGPQTISRGDGSGTLFPVGDGRRWELELRELSKLAELRVVSGDDGDRPAESIADRVTWLIGTVYLPVTDNGLITYDTTAMDANDYRGQRASDVLNDMANVIGFNWWIYYDQSAANEVSLAFFDPASNLYLSDISISNVASEVDNLTVFAPFEDGDVERDPDKIAAGVYLPYTGGAIYEYDYDTSYEFAFQDQVAPTASVKTEAKAIALADRFLADNDEQDERATVSIRLPAAQLNDVKHGQLITVKLQHVPDWEAGKDCRVVRKTFGPPNNRTSAFYDVELELSPVAVTSHPSGAMHTQRPGVSYSGQPTLPSATAEDDLLFIVVFGGGNTTQYPTTFGFINNPSVSPASPEVPPFLSLNGWTVMATSSTDYSGQNIGGPCGVAYHPGGGVCTAGLIVGMAWRRVQAGEESTVPVAVSTEILGSSCSAYLWNLGNRPDPSGSFVAANAHGTGNTITPALSSLSGNVVGAFYVPSGAGHGAVVQPTAVTTSATLVQANGSFANQDLPAPANVDNWITILQLPNGGAPSASISVVSAYTGLNWCGVAVELPAGILLPTIPYPANQVSG